MKRWIRTVAFVGMLGLAVPAAADEYWRDAGVGVSCVFVNLLYMPTKVGYATLGLVTGSLGYVLTGFNADVANTIWAPSLGGDYVVSRDHLFLERTLYFSGVIEAESADAEFEAIEPAAPADDYGDGMFD